MSSDDERVSQKCECDLQENCIAPSAGRDLLVKKSLHGDSSLDVQQDGAEPTLTAKI